MATANSAVDTGRDIRLDLFRGLALWFIFLDQIPTNIMSWLTVRNYGFSDATEIFVFISGYTAVIAYSRMMTQEGWPRAAARIYRRVWQLYVAHILLFVAFSAQIAWVSMARDTPALIEEMELLGFGQNPYRAIVEAALLRFRPGCRSASIEGDTGDVGDRRFCRLRARRVDRCCQPRPRRWQTTACSLGASVRSSSQQFRHANEGE